MDCSQNNLRYQKPEGGLEIGSKITDGVHLPGCDCADCIFPQTSGGRSHCQSVSGCGENLPIVD